MKNDIAQSIHDHIQSNISGDIKEIFGLSSYTQIKASLEEARLKDILESIMPKWWIVFVSKGGVLRRIAFRLIKVVLIEKNNG